MRASIGCASQQWPFAEHHLPAGVASTRRDVRGHIIDPRHVHELSAHGRHPLTAARGHHARRQTRAPTGPPCTSFGHPVIFLAIDPNNGKEHVRQRGCTALKEASSYTSQLDQGAARPGANSPARRAQRAILTTSSCSRTAPWWPPILGTAPLGSPIPQASSSAATAERPGSTALMPTCTTGPKTSSSTPRFCATDLVCRRVPAVWRRGADGRQWAVSNH